jgi:hypothetical protein
MKFSKYIAIVFFYSYFYPVATSGGQKTDFSQTSGTFMKKSAARNKKISS